MGWIMFKNLYFLGAVIVSALFTLLLPIAQCAATTVEQDQTFYYFNRVGNANDYVFITEQFDPGFPVNFPTPDPIVDFYVLFNIHAEVTIQPIGGGGGFGDDLARYYGNYGWENGSPGAHGGYSNFSGTGLGYLVGAVGIEIDRLVTVDVTCSLVSVCPTFGPSPIGITFYVSDGLELLDAPPTPLPAALPLFASGLGALGLLGWLKRRSVQIL